MSGGEAPVRSFLRRNGLALLSTALLFALTYRVVFNFRLGTSDYHDHLVWATLMSGRDMIAAFRSGQERLWHICVQLVLMLGVDNIWTGAALVTAAANAAAYLLVFLCWDRALPRALPRWLLAALMLAAFLAGSLTLPGHSFYVGRDTVNTWHNPTNIMVRPFAAAIFYMTVRIYARRRDRRGLSPDPAGAGSGGFAFSGGFWHQFCEPVFTRRELVLYPLCLYLSVCAKPSFLQFFAPAIFLFLLADVFRTRGMLLPFCVKLALAFLPAAVILLLQTFRLFGGGIRLAVAAAETASAGSAASAAATATGRAGLVFYFIAPSFSGVGDFLAQLARSLVRMVYPCAFPLFVLFAALPRLRGASAWLGFLCLAAGQLELMCLHETGARAGHGNLAWGYYLSIWLLWTVAMGKFVQLLRDKSRAGALVRWGGGALLAWHLVCGVCYLVRILQTAQYTF